MGLMQRAYETYCAMEQQYVGKYIEGKTEPLAPEGHTIKKIGIEISLNKDGSFISAVAVPEDDARTIIPTTEDSLGRSGTKAYMMPFPLCEKLEFLLAEENYYIPELQKWAESKWTHPTVAAVYKYMQCGRIKMDLENADLLKKNKDGKLSNKDDMVRWRVIGGEQVPECWKDFTLFYSFLQYYKSMLDSPIQYCMITGKQEKTSEKHPKGVVALNGNAKLISANDSSGFTYRGRFSVAQEAASISYEASQKVHNVLRWLIANDSVIIGGRAFLCWNPQGIKIMQPHLPMLKNSGTKHTISTYKKDLQGELYGLKSKLRPQDSAVLAAFDAGTPGRLALTYYDEMPMSDFFDRIAKWDEECCWWNGPFGIQAPSILSVAQIAYGTLRSEGSTGSDSKALGKQTQRFVADDKVLCQHIQRLLTCRINGAKLQVDFSRALALKATNIKLIDDSKEREKVLHTACAVIRKTELDQKGEEYQMALEENKKNISYQYGRLLAVLEKVERDTYSNDEKREPNAIRLQNVFTKRPMHTFRIIQEQLKTGYYPKLSPGQRSYYEKLIEEIISQISEYSVSEQNAALKDVYLLGYYLQKKEMYQPKAEKEEE